MDNVVIESFIAHCDEMMIAEEGFGDKVLSMTKKAIQNILDTIREIIQKIMSLLKLDKGDKVSKKAYNAYKKAISEYENLLKEADDAISDVSSKIKIVGSRGINLTSILSIGSKVFPISDEFSKIIRSLESNEEKDLVSLNKNYLMRQVSFYEAAAKKEAKEVDTWNVDNLKSLDMEYEEKKNYCSLMRRLFMEKCSIYLEMLKVTHILISSIDNGNLK